MKQIKATKSIEEDDKKDGIFFSCLRDDLFFEVRSAAFQLRKEKGCFLKDISYF